MRPLPPDELHLWRAWVDTSGRACENDRRILGAEELARAGRFRSETDRRRFVARRGLLRRIVAGYVDGDPSELVIVRDCRYCGDSRHGRPRLLLDGAESDVRFSQAGSGRLAVYAVVRKRGVGIDVEVVDVAAPVEAIVGQALSAEEARSLGAVPVALRPSAALLAWTAKEAYLKATGRGLAEDPRSVAVTVDPRSPASLAPGGVGDRWTLRRLAPSPDHVGAVAVHDPGHDLRVLAWMEAG